MQEINRRCYFCSIVHKYFKKPEKISLSMSVNILFLSCSQNYTLKCKMSNAAVSCDSPGFISKSSVHSCGSPGIFFVTGQVTELLVFLCLNKKYFLIHCDSCKNSKEDDLSLARSKSRQDIVATKCPVHCVIMQLFKVV